MYYLFSFLGWCQPIGLQVYDLPISHNIWTRLSFYNPNLNLLQFCERQILFDPLVCIWADKKFYGMLYETFYLILYQDEYGHVNFWNFKF